MDASSLLRHRSKAPPGENGGERKHNEPQREFDTSRAAASPPVTAQADRMTWGLSDGRTSFGCCRARKTAACGRDVAGLPGLFCAHADGADVAAGSADEGYLHLRAHSAQAAKRL